MPSPKVAEWANCNLRYVAETKLARLDDGDLLELRRLLTAKLGRPTAHLATNGPVAREGMISEIMDLKKDLSKLSVEPVGLSPPPPKEQQRRVSFEQPQGPHEERDAQGGADEEEAEAAVRKVVKDAMEKVEPNVVEKATEPLPGGVTEDQVERVKALIALKAAAELEPPPPPEPKAKPEAAPTDEPLVVQTHQLRICSFNALKLRLSNPTGKAPNEDDDDENSVGYKGSEEGEQLTRKWLMLAAVMSSYDVIVMQEFAGVNKQGKDCTEDVCLAPIVEEMNKMLRDKMHGSTEDGNRLYEYSGISTSNDARYWHPYAIISRLPMSNFSQEEPVECQGMCGVTVSFPSGQHLRIYTSHLYYKPEERYQTDEINAHAMYMEGESRSTKMLDYKNILWGGDFNNRSLQCKAMKLIGRYGFKTTLPFHYVDTFFFRARHGVVEGSGGGEQGGEGSEILETKYYSPVGNFRTHKYFLYREDRLFGGGSHSDHLPVCTLVSLRKGV